MFVKILNDNETLIMECATFKAMCVEDKRMLFLDDALAFEYDPEADPPYILLMNSDGKTIDTIQHRKRPS